MYILIMLPFTTTKPVSDTQVKENTDWWKHKRIKTFFSLQVLSNGLKVLNVAQKKHFSVFFCFVSLFTFRNKYKTLSKKGSLNFSRKMLSASCFQPLGILPVVDYEIHFKWQVKTWTNSCIYMIMIVKFQVQSRRYKIYLNSRIVREFLDEFWGFADGKFLSGIEYFK